MTDFLSPERLTIILALGIILTSFLIASLFNRFMKRFIKKNQEDLNKDIANYHFLRRAVSVLILLLGLSLAIYSIPGLKAVAQSMLAGAGIAAVAIGFASQAALSNIIAGVFIIIFKPFRTNDRIEIGTNITGVVEDITLRHTVIRNFQNKRIIIPNSIISNESILNADLIDQKVIQWIEIGISYQADIDLAKKILEEEALNHPLLIDNRSDEQKQEGEPIVRVRVIALGEYSITLRAWAWAKDQADAFVLKCDLLEIIKKRFDREGIEIPFPYRTLIIKNKTDGDFSSPEKV